MGGGKKIRVGLDFDGVVAYNPARVIRAPVKWFKGQFLGKKEVSFFMPKNWWQKLVWAMIHESSIWPARGVTRLRRMVRDGEIEAHLITGRFEFLEENLNKWLKKNLLDDVFETINVNREGRQPHEFKLETIKKLGVKCYVEDNLDIVEYVAARSSARVLWIYNVLDKNYPYRDKFPCLEEALKTIEL